MLSILFFSVFVGSLVLALFLYKAWWIPIYIQSFMNSQGIKGPPYKFPYGNSREIRDMKSRADSAPMEQLSHNIFPKLQPHIHTWINLYGRTFLFWIHSRPQLVVTDVELIKEILSNREGSFAKMEVEGPLKMLLGDGLPFLEGQKWSRLRKVADYAFHAQSLKEMIPAMTESVEVMLETWKSYEGKEIEVFREFGIISSDIISKTAFGSCYLDGKHVFEMLDKLALICYMSFQKTRIPGIESSYDIEADKLQQNLRDSFVEMIKEREDKVKAGQTDCYGDDFLGSLLEAHHDVDEEIRISVDDIIGECKTFYFGGHETVTSLLSWSVLLLAIHTDWQEKARKEVIEIIGQENPKTDSISRLKIVGMIINETLRLYAPATFIVRRVTKKTRLGKLTLPAGIGLNIPTLAVHNSCEIWGEDAHVFKPERFCEGVANATGNQMMAFLPFGFGLRKCVGSDFASVEVKIVLSMILQRYKIAVSPNYSHFPTVVLALRPKQGIQVMLHPL